MEISEERLKEVIRAHEHPEDWPCGEEVACLDEKEELALCVELLERRKADRWIQVSERLPDAVDDYLVEIQSARGLAKWRDVKTFADGKFHGMRCGDNVTHWRPLPVPPEVSNG